MAIRLRVIERPADDDSFFADAEGRERTGWWYKPETWGAMWRTPEHDLPDRESWCIVLPNGAGIWNTTEHASLREPGGYGKGPLWDVTGMPPDITVKPSIDAGLLGWHGWITNGEMT